jgi:Ni,Fe-hydrogenase III large subunit
LGTVGVGGRASEIDLDVRRDHAYAAYSPFRGPVYRDGDVLRRMQVRVDEVAESIGILRAATDDLPEGPWCAPVRPIPPGRCALSAVEGWRGEILH